MDLTEEFIVGVSVNNVTGITGKSYEVSDLIHASVEAENMGFDAIWVHDAPQGRRTTAAYDAVNLLTAVARETSELRVCTGILMPHLRNPVSLATTWATLWEISSGRAIMGVGTGGGKKVLQDREFQALAALKHRTDLDAGELYKQRGKLYEECLDVIRTLWREDKIDYDGEFYRFNQVTLGKARPDVPPPILASAGIYFPEQPGSHVQHAWKEERAGKYILGPHERVAKYGEGWLTVHTTPDENDRYWRKMQEYADEHRSGKQIARALNFFVNVDEDPDKAWQGVKDQLRDFHGPPVPDDLVDRWALSGTPEQVTRKLQTYIDHGVHIFQLVIGSPDQLEQMRRLAEHVLPNLDRP